MELTFEIQGLRERMQQHRLFAEALRGSHVVGKLTADARNMVVERTLQGLDADGNPFKPYSSKPLYISAHHRPRPKGGQKTKGGKSRFFAGGYAEYRQATVGHQRPDLFASGDMFRAFQARELTPTKGIVHFIKTKEALKAVANDATRHFVGLSAAQADGLQERFEAMVDKMLQQHGLA